MIISLDTETTGVDLAHGAMPFIVTTCDDSGIIRFWEWDVNPLTRKSEVPSEDIAAIVDLIDEAELIYLHNSKFDARALATIGIDLPWLKVRDTLVAAHLLATNHPHDLTSLCIEHLGINIEPYELHVEEVVKECRKITKQLFPNWFLAEEGKQGMPSVKGGSKRDEDKPWKNDMWLPRALAKQSTANQWAQYDPEWLDAASKYANADSATTLPLGLHMERLIQERGYWKIYESRLRLPQCACEMESYGVSARGDYTETTIQEYEEHTAEVATTLVDIANEFGHELELAQGAALNDNMREFFYGAVVDECPRCGMQKHIKHWNGEGQASWLEPPTCPKCGEGNTRRTPVKVEMVRSQRSNLALPVILSNKTGNASLDKDAMAEYIQTLDDGPALEFVELLADKRMYETALGYMQAYKRFWLPVAGHPGYYRIHCSLNPFATDHLRWGSNSPNMQNVAGESKELSNRYCFGPLPDREWWRMDYKSIESRIPAYESGEPSLVELFDRPNDPPYFGSQYNLVASILYPNEYAPHSTVSGSFKTNEPKLYKRAKFFVLARNYGAGKYKGDRLAGFIGASDMIESGMPKLAALQAKYLRDAERYGFVETLPSRAVDPTHGYPVLASRTEEGRVLSTTPFNYHISGTACDCKNLGLIRCIDQCAEWQEEGFDAHVILEVHDELVFDFPRGKNIEENLPLALVLKAHMEQSGEDLIPRIPTPVSCEYITDSWADGVSI